MRKKLDILLSTMEMPLGYGKANGWSDPSNPHNNYLRIYFDAIASFSINMTLVTSSEAELGLLGPNGTYTGLLGVVQKHQTDATAFPIPCNGLAQAFDVTPVIYEYSYAIHAFRSSQKQRGEVLESVDCFDRITNLVILGFLLCAFIMLKHARCGNALMTLVATALVQGFLKKPKVAILLTILIFWIHKVVNANFSTDLTKTVQEPKVDNLRDLAERKDLCPKFIKGYPIYRTFERRFTRTYGEVWDNVLQCGFSDSVVEIDRLQDVRITSEQNSFLGPNFIRSILVMWACMIDPERIIERVEEGVAYDESEWFLRELAVYSVHKQTSGEKKNRLIEVAYFMLEEGITFHFADVSYRIIPVLNQKQRSCIIALNHAQSPVNDGQSLRIVDFHLSFCLLAVVLLTALVAFLFETIVVNCFYK